MIADFKWEIFRDLCILVIFFKKAFEILLFCFTQDKKSTLYLRYIINSGIWSTKFLSNEWSYISVTSGEHFEPCVSPISSLWNVPLNFRKLFPIISSTISPKSNVLIFLIYTGIHWYYRPSDLRPILLILGCLYTMIKYPLIQKWRLGSISLFSKCLAVHDCFSYMFFVFRFSIIGRRK
jgi:hypothetical protein